MSWKLQFTTESDGYSLRYLLAKMKQKCPNDVVLLVVKDIEDHSFGAVVMPRRPRSPTNRASGNTAPSLLWTFYPEFKTFSWSGRNDEFLKYPSNSGVFVGCQSGKAGLWLDEELYGGSSQRCSTSKNAPLTESQDFLIKGVEMWSLC